MARTLKERLGFKPKVIEAVVTLTPEEERTEKKRQRKLRMAAEKKEQDKKDRRQQRRIDHANSSGGVFTQCYKKDNGDISKWRSFPVLASLAI